jgi:hypothetical protein
LIDSKIPKTRRNKQEVTVSKTKKVIKIKDH